MVNPRFTSVISMGAVLEDNPIFNGLVDPLNNVVIDLDTKAVATGPSAGSSRGTTATSGAPVITSVYSDGVTMRSGRAFTVMAAALACCVVAIIILTTLLVGAGLGTRVRCGLGGL